jgi:hypothetical protein
LDLAFFCHSFHDNIEPDTIFTTKRHDDCDTLWIDDTTGPQVKRVSNERPFGRELDAGWLLSYQAKENRVSDALGTQDMHL